MNELFPKPKSEFDAGNNKEYKVAVIIDSAIYTKEVKRHLLGLYYLVSGKSYPEEKSTWESSSAIMYLWKMFSTFHKNHLEKPTATSPSLDFTPPIAKPSVKPAKPFAKQKQGYLTGSIKRAKK